MSLGGDRIVEHRRVQRAPPPPPLTAPPSHPRHGLLGPTQSKPRPPPPIHHRVHRVDEAGSVTLRVAGRLHHIGVGRAHARTRVLILVHDLNIRIINATTGGLLRYLILDPTCHYQPTGNPKGPVPAKTVSMRQRDPQIASLGHGGRDTATKRIAEIGENEGRSWPRRQLRG